MAMQQYYLSRFFVDPHHQMVWCHIQKTRWESFTLIQRCSQHILQSQLTGIILSKQLKFQVTILNANNLPYKINTNNLHTVKWFQDFLTLMILFHNHFLYTVMWFNVFFSNTYNFLIYLFDRRQESYWYNESGPESNGNEEVLHTPRSPKLELLTLVLDR